MTPHELKLNGKTGWDSTLPDVGDVQTLDNRLDANATGGTQPQAEVALDTYPTPSCSKMGPSFARGLQRLDLDQLIRCTFLQPCSTHQNLLM